MQTIHIFPPFFILERKNSLLVILSAFIVHFVLFTTAICRYCINNAGSHETFRRFLLLSGGRLICNPIALINRKVTPRER